MFDKIESILAALVAKLGTILPEEFSIYRDDLGTLDASKLPAVAVLPISDSMENLEVELTSGAHTRILKVRIVIASSGTPVSTVISPIANTIAINLLKDFRLGGLVSNIHITELRFGGEKTTEADYADGSLELDVFYRARL